MIWGWVKFTLETVFQLAVLAGVMLALSIWLGAYMEALSF